MCLDAHCRKISSHHHHTIITPSSHHHHTIITTSSLHHHNIITPSSHHHHNIITPSQYTITNLYWATRREQLAAEKPSPSPLMILAVMREARWGERLRRSQLEVPSKLLTMMAFFGPNLPPKYPPVRQPGTKTRLIILAEIDRIDWIVLCFGKMFLCSYQTRRALRQRPVFWEERRDWHWSWVVWCGVVVDVSVSYSHLISLLMSGMATAEKAKLYPLRRVPR